MHLDKAAPSALPKQMTMSAHCGATLAYENAPAMLFWELGGFL